MDVDAVDVDNVNVNAVDAGVVVMLVLQQCFDALMLSFVLVW